MLICQHRARKAVVCDGNKADGRVSPVPVVITVLLLEDSSLIKVKLKTGASASMPGDYLMFRCK